VEIVPASGVGFIEKLSVEGMDTELRDTHASYSHLAGEVIHDRIQPNGPRYSGSRLAGRRSSDGRAIQLGRSSGDTLRAV
jgi:hypothetical protein